MSFFKIGKSVFKITLLIAIATIALRAQATAGPVEYVKLCNMYGTGFVNLSGTDTCMRASLGGQVGYGGTTTNFNVNPSFDVNGTGFVYGFSGMVVAGIPHTNLSFGPRISVFGGDMSGSTFYSGSGGSYDVRTRGIVAGDVVVQYAPESWRGFAGRAFIGIADVRTQTEYGVVRTFRGIDTSTNTGITAGVGVNAPITNFPGGLSVTGEFRYIGLTNNINIPGAVGTHRDSLIGTLGLEYDFAAK